MKHVTHRVSHKQQEKDYDCGPTCLEMLLDFYGIPYDREQLDSLCEAQPARGTDNGKLVEAVRHYGAEPVVKENASLDDIIKTIKNGHPVLVNYFNCKSSVGHFGVVKGVDEEGKALI